MYSSIFTSTRSDKDGHKMIFPWMRRSKTVMLGEGDKRSLPCVGLQAGLNREMYVPNIIQKTHIGNRDGGSHCIVELSEG
jgi:hypothetical protein